MMEQKRFDWLVENSTAELAFANDTTEHVWRVRLCDGRMLARLDCEDYNDDTVSYYDYDIEYGEVEEADELYWDIVCDVISVLGDAMYRRELAKYGFLSSYASQEDESLSELLSYFGVNWSEFVGDVFYMFGLYVEIMDEEDEVDNLGDDWSYEDICDLFDSEPYADVMIDYGDGAAIYWQVANYGNKVVYHSLSMIDDGDEVLSGSNQYGVFDEDDEVAFECLRDAIVADIEACECSLDYDIALFELLDIEVFDEEED